MKSLSYEFVTLTNHDFENRELNQKNLSRVTRRMR